MIVMVEYFGPARDAAGRARESVEFVPPCPAVELVERIARERGGRLASLLLIDGRLSHSVLLSVGDRQIGRDEDVLLRDGDEVLIIPPVSGG